MNNRIKEAVDKIEIPTELHTRAKMGVKQAKSEQVKHKTFKKLKNPLVAAAIVSVITVGSLVSPTVQATVENLFTFSKVDRVEQATIGWMWEGAGDEGKTYNSLEEIENKFMMNIPFPEKLLLAEEGSVRKEYRVNTEKGKFVSFTYELRTNDRYYIVSATNLERVNPEFTASTTKDTVIEKDVLVHGTKGTLIGIYDMDDVYSLYLEKEGWKIIIYGLAEGINKVESKLTEQEMITIAESIN